MGIGIPEYRLLPEVGLVGHVAGDGGMVAEDGIFGHRLAGLYRLEEVPQVRMTLSIVATIGTT